MLLKCIKTKKTPVRYTTSTEAEAIKLFSNTYLAMRIAYFNELESYCEKNKLHTKTVIPGMSFDPSIGDYDTPPSCGYGGYCSSKRYKTIIKKL